MPQCWRRHYLIAVWCLVRLGCVRYSSPPVGSQQMRLLAAVFGAFICGCSPAVVAPPPPATDWLVAAGPPAASYVAKRCWKYTPDAPLCGLEIGNGLVARRFVTSPAFGTVDFVLNATARFGGTQSMFRATTPEGAIVLDGTTYTIGGLEQARTFLAYANRSEFQLQPPSARGRALWGATSTFLYVNHSVGRPTGAAAGLQPFPWTPGRRGSPPNLQWPPKGVTLAVDFRPESWTAHRDFVLTMTYEVYDGLPLVAKSMALRHRPAAALPSPPTADTAVAAAAPLGASDAPICGPNPGGRMVNHSCPKPPCGQYPYFGLQCAALTDCGICSNEHACLCCPDLAGPSCCRPVAAGHSCNSTGGNSSSSIAGWRVLGGKLGSAPSPRYLGLCLTNDNSTSTAQAVYTHAATSVSATLSGWGAAGAEALRQPQQPQPQLQPQQHGMPAGGGVLLGLAAAAVELPFARDKLDYWCYWMFGSGDIYIGQFGSAPANVGSAHDSGTTMSMQLETTGSHTGQIAVMSNGVALAWLPKAKKTTGLHPTIETLSYAPGHDYPYPCSIQPASGSPRCGKLLFCAIS
jgi:hypothetical protein